MKKWKVLLLGAGGREHALAWKIAQSPLLGELYIAPGNPGTAQHGQNVALDIADHSALLAFCQQKNIDLVMVGPEAPLAAGVADALTAAGLRCFGPSQAAAQLEASKAFAKDFMTRHAIPTARYAVFTRFSEAAAFLEQVDYPVVIKASGLAAGKGVVLPESQAEARQTLQAMLEQGLLGAAGQQVVIEERLTGPEISLMAFSDGETVLPMLPAQDHKRLLDHNLGPNTGGMGAYAPAAILTEALQAEALQTVLRPAIAGLRAEGRPFVGVLYAGLMLTPQGLRVLEFNCRFGDPETQALLPLLQSDLLEIALACAEGRLGQIQLRWRDAAAVCVVLASQGYPEKPESGQPLQISALPADCVVFQAGTRRAETGQILSAGGRVLGVTALAASLPQAVDQAYRAVSQISFQGRQYRSDIASSQVASSAYARAGVSIDAGNRAVALMKAAVQKTYTPAVLSGIGSFGGLFDAASLKALRSPVLVASTDGVGTKVKLAAQFGSFGSIGQDIVNHCIDDILVQGARPLFFMDYFATAKLIPEQTAEIVTGMARACQAAGMVLLGGETAEMPGVYLPGEFDVAGTIVGLLERDSLLPRSADFQPGDVLMGLRSSGPHTNGYSLIRKIFSPADYTTLQPEPGQRLIDLLLRPHRSYLPVLEKALQVPGLVKGLVHLTGGGFIENIPRILPAHLDAKIRLGSWPLSPLWQTIQLAGKIALPEMYRVFNMGIGMVAVLDPAAVTEFRRLVDEETWHIGELIAGSQKTLLS